MFKKYKEKKRLEQERALHHKEQKVLIDAFLEEYHIESKLEKSIFTEMPYVVDLYSKPSKDVADAILELDYGRLNGSIYTANPDKFEINVKDLVKMYNSFKKNINDEIELKRKLGKTYLYEFFYVDGFSLNYWHIFGDRLKKDFPKLDLRIHIPVYAFGSDKIEVSGNI